MNKVILAVLNIFLFCFGAANTGWALENPALPITAFHIGQEQSNRDGVLTAGPRAIDQKIVFLLQRNHIQSLEDYSTWLQENIVYQKNLGMHHWPTPEQTLAQRCGDCKNFVSLNVAVLQVAGFKPRIMACIMPQQSHAICVFQANGYYFWFDNAVIKKTSAKSLPAFARKMVRQYNILSLLEFDSQNNRWEIIYQRS